MLVENQIESLKDMVRESVMNKNLEINLEDNLKDDLGLDSMGRVELTVLIESEFEIELTEDELVNIVTFKDVVEMIESKLAK